MSTESPNYASSQPIRLFDIGYSDRRPDESEQEWRRRTKAKLDEEALVALLRDAALSGAEAAEPRQVRWAGSGLPGPLGIF